MNKQLRVAGLIFVLGLVLGLGGWQQQGWAAGRAELTQASNTLKQLFFPAVASKAFRPAPGSVAAPVPAALAATITVTNLADGAANAANCPGVGCRLRDAIAKAVAGDTINFSVNGTITLTNGELLITQSMNINGPGAALLTISGNHVSRVLEIRNATVALNDLTITGGSTTQVGGGILNFGGSNLTITNSEISGNSAVQGGGIANDFDCALTIRNSTISGNSATTYGGGIVVLGGPVKLFNTTLSGNSAIAGGAIFTPTTNTNSTLTLRNCTITANTASNRGAGIYRDLSAVTPVDMRNTIVAENTALTGPDLSGTFGTSGYNLIGNLNDATLIVFGAPNVVNVNPLLGPLRNNGGPTKTHALLPGSPALDAAGAAVDPDGLPIVTDQRGLPRVRDLTTPNVSGGTGTDIGAFELQNDPLLTINPSTLSGGTVGTAYSQNLSATGGSGNYQFSVLSSSLPFGLTLSVAGQITGIPTSGGNVTFTVRAADNGIAIDTYGLRTYTVAITPGACASAPPGLTAWWQAAGNANDAVGNNHATLNGSASISTVAEGHKGQAFKFDGTNGYVALPDNLFPFPTAGSGAAPFSFEIWFKSARSGGVVLGQQTVAPYNMLGSYVPAIYVGTDGKLRVQMFWNGTSDPLVSANPVNDNGTYHHVVVSYDGTQQIVYLDGQAMGSRAYLQSSYSSSYKYQLGTGGASGWPMGSADNNGWFNFTGFIDEPSLYNSALTAGQVQTLFAAGSAGKCAPPCLVVANPAKTTGTVGILFDQMFTQTGGVAPVTFSLASGTLPTGLTLASNGRLSGIPAQSGAFALTVRATDSAGCTQVGGTYILNICNNLVVTSNADSGAGSLREAIALACSGGGSAITFASGISSITLTSGELIIDKSLTITGPGANLLTISGNHAFRVFKVNTGVIASISGLTIANGSVSNDGGGGIFTNGDLTLTNCAFTGNLAGTGGGGLLNWALGSMTITNCTFTGNSAGTGGGLRNINVTNINNCTFNNNSANEGAGLMNDGTMTITNSTFSGNPASRIGGGIYNFDTLTLINCTLSGNTASVGGGVYRQSGSINARNTLIAGNTLVAGNTVTSEGPDVSGTLTSLGHNLIGNNSGATITSVTGDQIGTAAAPINPLLAALANNGGATQTMALLPGSPALNAGDNCVAQMPGCLPAPLTTDQRGTGFTRLAGSAVDIGAYELNTAPTFTPAAAISRQKGSAAGAAAAVGTVSDAQTAAGLLTVTQIAGGTATGITVSGITNTNGAITAVVSASCTATAGTVRFQVSDGNLTGTGDLTVTLTANTQPTLSYNNASVNGSTAATVSPATGPSDNGSISTIVVQSVTPSISPATLSVHNSTGVVTVPSNIPVGSYTVTIRATDNCGMTKDASFTLTVVNGGSSNGLQFYPLAHPVRLLDTRVGGSGCDAPGAKIAGATSRTQTAAGRTCDGVTIPANANALTGNITTVESGGGFLTLFPSDATRPLVANSNFAANQVLNNVFTVGLGAANGAFNIYVTTNTDVVVDITGYYAPPATGGLYFHPLPKPVRLLDTRAGQTACFTTGTPLTAGFTTTQLGTTTCDGVLIPAGAQALVGNATAVSPQANGFLTVFPADASRPPTASSNFQTGINMNAPFTVGLSPSGQFNIYTAATVDLVVDILGYYSTQLNDSNGSGLLFNSLPTPVRLLDTRSGQSGCVTPGAPMTGGTAYLQSAIGACTGIPAAAKAVVGNATTTNVAANGFLTFWPSDANQPLVATSNYRTGQTFNRHFTVGIGLDGAFKRFASTTSDLIIDISGFFAP